MITVKVFTPVSKAKILQNKISKTYLVYSISWDGLRIKSSLINTSIINPIENWDFEKLCIKRSTPNYSELTTRIKNFAVAVEKFYFNAIASGKSINVSEMKQKVEELLEPERRLNEIDVPKEKTFKDYFKEYLEYRTKTDIKEASLKHDKTIKKHLFEYANKNKLDLSLDNIDMNFYSNFTKFLQKKSLRDSTIGSIIKFMKAFMNFTYFEGYHNNLKFKKFKVLKEEPVPITLTGEELQILQTKEFDSKKLNQIKDLFLIQIYTCLRVSDLMSITMKNIDLEKNQIVGIVTQKTNVKIPPIPLNPILRSILLRYNDSGLPRYSNQKYNIYIKELCKELGFDNEIEIKQFYNGKAKIEKKMKYELISSHSARRTGATLYYKSGYPKYYIMKLTGHKTEKSFLRYIGLEDDELLQDFENGFDWNKILNNKNFRHG